jgi:hypothetical protein
VVRVGGFATSAERIPSSDLREGLPAKATSKNILSFFDRSHHFAPTLFSALYGLCVWRVCLPLLMGQGPSGRRTQGQFHHRLPRKTSLKIDPPDEKKDMRLSALVEPHVIALLKTQAPTRI